MNVLVLTEDLIFSSKIKAAASRCGTVVYMATDLNQLDQALREKTLHLAVVDLNSSKVSPLESVRAIRQALPQLPILGFCSHVQTELQQQALAAGCTRVLPRSIFARQLPDLLAAAPPR